MKQTWLRGLGLSSVLFFMSVIPVANAQDGVNAQDAEVLQDKNTPFLDAFITQAQSGQLLTMDFTALSEDDFTGQSTEVSGRVALGVGFSRFETDDRVIVMIGDTSWVMDRSQNRVIISVLALEEREFSVEWFLREKDHAISSNPRNETTMAFDEDLPWQLEQVTMETIAGQVLEKITIASTDPFSTWETAQLWMAMREGSARDRTQATGESKGEPIKLVVNDPVGATTSTQFTNQRWLDWDMTSTAHPLALAQNSDEPWALPVDQDTQITDLRESFENQEDDL
ncbi:MAG TPA: hypothetical protein DEF03_01460 [Bacteroidetes bacterium]|nr:MAG: hypothetical protein DBW78_02470 [Rhodothermaeota bacterium MED-G64]HBV99840.1 hypothetical protein [Bacteroidota bacterium]|tara:strand:+ start:1207 stop:2058 length:852 start_codon:yes stop_codon:yes gene_type:complete